MFIWGWIRINFSLVNWIDYLKYISQNRFLFILKLQINKMVETPVYYKFKTPITESDIMNGYIETYFSIEENEAKVITGDIQNKGFSLERISGDSAISALANHVRKVRIGINLKKH